MSDSDKILKPDELRDCYRRRIGLGQMRLTDCPDWCVVNHGPAEEFEAFVLCSDRVG